MADWPVYPIVKKAVEIDLSDDEHELIDALRRTGDFGTEDGEILRSAFFSWWIEHYMRGPKHFVV